MKKIFLIAAAMLALAGCKKEPEEPAAGPDAISVAPEERIFDADGGYADVIVTSTGDWSLGTKDNQSYDWVTTDKTSGKDGDIVRFTVDKNDGKDGTRTAEFVFSCGEATAPFTITSVPGDVPVITLVSDGTESLGYEAGTLRVELSLSEGMSYRSLTQSVEQEMEWLTYAMVLEGETAGTAVMDFDYTLNDGLEARTATITIGYEGANPVTVEVTQMPQSILKVDQPSQNLGVEAGVLTINVEANVEYTVSLSEGADSWLTGQKNDGNIWTWNYSAWTEAGLRQAVITFTESEPAGDAAPMTATVTVKQSNFIINTAAYMKAHCAGVAEWKTPDVMKLGTTLTVELLVKHDKDFEVTSSWNGNGIGTLFGTERRFLIRHGDNMNNYKEWELVYVLNATESNGEYIESKVKSSKDLPADEWVHIAAVLDGAAKTVTLYQNGEVVGSADMASDIRDIDLTEEYERTAEGLQKFYLGRSYANNRDFCGLMSEVRVWNMALSAAEINAENHFYTVDPNSEGLVAYWKMNEGEGYLIKDHTANGNNLTGEVYSGYSWSNGMEWREVQLP
ncbi:MAG: hypothetical protein IAC23_05080 [Bacteroidetes bacterium]|uniref:BACON domain-containing protein n=1 Tax=Candidatus Cryptobacteroides merdavium TaxID=2840769 RepID=A0A9D9HCP0_9BACT|nr:hypothetical protein [Candidatus Cryptobacteroides merdavium]